MNIGDIKVILITGENIVRYCRDDTRHYRSYVSYAPFYVLEGVGGGHTTSNIPWVLKFKEEGGRPWTWLENTNTFLLFHSPWVHVSWSAWWVTHSILSWALRQQPGHQIGTSTVIYLSPDQLTFNTLPLVTIRPHKKYFVGIHHVFTSAVLTFFSK